MLAGILLLALVSHTNERLTPATRAYLLQRERMFDCLIFWFPFDF